MASPPPAPPGRLRPSARAFGAPTRHPQGLSAPRPMASPQKGAPHRGNPIKPPQISICPLWPKTGLFSGIRGSLQLANITILPSLPTLSISSPRHYPLETPLPCKHHAQKPARDRAPVFGKKSGVRNHRRFSRKKAGTGTLKSPRKLFRSSSVQRTAIKIGEGLCCTAFLRQGVPR